VRSRSVFGSIGASLQTLVGGDISLFTELCEKTREDAFDRMLQHAAEKGATAVVGVRYDATELMQGVTEVLCYGTAVQIKASLSTQLRGGSVVAQALACEVFFASQLIELPDPDIPETDRLTLIPCACSLIGARSYFL